MRTKILSFLLKVIDGFKALKESNVIGWLKGWRNKLAVIEGIILLVAAGIFTDFIKGGCRTFGISAVDGELKGFLATFDNHVTVP